MTAHELLALLPLILASYVFMTKGQAGLLGLVGQAAEIDQMKGLVTAFAVGNVALSLLYAACLGFAAIHPDKRAVHDLLVGSRVVHVRSVTPAAVESARKSRISV